MVSFVCDNCQATVKKPKLDQHYNRCHAAFSCVDCYTTFSNYEWSGHTSCISEVQKVQGKPAKAPKNTAAVSSSSAPAKDVNKEKPQAVEKKVEEEKKEAPKTESKKRTRDTTEDSIDTAPSDAKKPKLVEEESKEDISSIEKHYSHLKVKRAMKKALKKASGKSMPQADLVRIAVESLQESMKSDLEKLVVHNLSHFKQEGGTVSLKKKK